jgi:hypothetical protein
VVGRPVPIAEVEDAFVRHFVTVMERTSLESVSTATVRA